MSAATETATVSRRGKKAKQDDLPGVDQSDRKIQELETLGDELADLQDEMATLKGKVKDVDENLVAAMMRRERTYYNRPTWGSIVLSEASVKARVKKHSASTNGDGADDDHEDE